MAGDWIKMRASLCTNPKVLLIADIISDSIEVCRRLSTGFNGSLRDIVTSDVTRDITLAALLRVWCATNEHTSDGVWQKSSLRTLDQASGITGFGEAMSIAGWAVYDEDAETVTLPNFLENNAPAKNNARSTGADRQARYRANKAKRDAESNVTRDVTMSVTSDAREEKRREEKKELKTPAAAPFGFAEFWSVYPKKKAKPKAEQAWRKLGHVNGLLPTILNAVQQQAHSEDWAKEGGKYIPEPASWLNAHRWEDEGVVAPSAKPWEL